VERRTWPKRAIMQLLLLLGINAAGILLFYRIDVSRVLQDQGMQNYWKEFMVQGGFNVLTILKNIYLLFAHMGAGGLFEIVFGLLGITGWINGIYQIRNHILSYQIRHVVTAYATILVAVMIALFITGKLP